MIIETIRTQMLQARKSGNKADYVLLNTLYSDAIKVGKDNGNRVSTDAEVIATIRKFINTTQETIQLLNSRGMDSSIQTNELALLNSLLPTQLTEAELKTSIQTIISLLPIPDKSGKSFGLVMAQLKIEYAGLFDPKVAREIFQSI
jgi:uncharacterized protein